MLIKILGRDLTRPTSICNQVPQTGSSFLWAGWEAEFHKTWAKWLLRRNYMVVFSLWLFIQLREFNALNRSQPEETQDWRSIRSRPDTRRLSADPPGPTPLFIYVNFVHFPTSFYDCLLHRWSLQEFSQAWVKSLSVILSGGLTGSAICMRDRGSSWERAHPRWGGRAPFWPKDNGTGSEGKGQSECSPAPVTPTHPSAQPPWPTPGSQGEGLPWKNPVRTRGIGKLESSSKQERREGAAPLCRASCSQDGRIGWTPSKKTSTDRHGGERPGSQAAVWAVPSEQQASLQQAGGEKSRGKGQMVAQSKVRNTCGPPSEDSLHAPEKPKGPGIPTEQVGAVAGEGNDSFFDLIFILHWWGLGNTSNTLSKRNYCQSTR